jgi:hypothetical protein
LKRLLKPKKHQNGSFPGIKPRFFAIVFVVFVLFGFSDVWSRWHDGRGLTAPLAPRAWALVVCDCGWRCSLGGHASSCSEREWPLRIQAPPITPCGWVGAERVALQHISKKQNGLHTNYRLAYLLQGMMAVS